MLEQFFISPEALNSVNIVSGTYNFTLVLLSFIVVFLAAYSAIFLIRRTAHDHHGSNLPLVLNGGIIMGAGIWSMHFIGMLAYEMPMPYEYNILITLLSMIIAILFSWIVFYNITSTKLSTLNIALNAPVMGVGISCMHYLGMLAMEMDGNIYFLSDYFSLSVVVAMIATAAALIILRKIYTHKEADIRWHLMAAAALALGVCSMHYIGMHATVFVPSADCQFIEAENHLGTAMLIVGVSVLIIVIGLFSISRTTSEHYMSEHAKPRWHYLYYLLAVFNILTMGISLYSNHTLSEDLDRYFGKFMQWHELQDDLATLHFHESELFNYMIHKQSHDIDQDHTYNTDEELNNRPREIQRIAARVQSIIEKETSYSLYLKHALEAQKLLVELENIHTDFQQQKQRAHATHFQDEHKDAILAIKELAEQEQSLITSAMHIIIEIQDIVSNERAHAIQRLKINEYIILGVISIIVLLALLYGIKIAHKVKEDEEEREKFQLELKQSRDNLEKQIEEQTKEIRAESIKNALLGKIAEHSNQSRTLDAAMKGAIREVISFSGWELGHVFLHLEHLDKTVNVWYHAPSESFKSFITSTNSLPDFFAPDFIPGLSTTHHQVTWIENMEEHTSLSRKSAAQHANLAGLAAIPIIVGHEYIGFMEFFSKREMTPNFELILILERLSMMMARVIEKFINQESLKTAKVRAEEASVAKSEFLSNMSHELRTPMHAILRFSENGMEDVKNAKREELYEYFNDIHISGERLTKLINNLLDLSKLESHTPDMSFSPGSLASINDHAVKELHSLIDDKKLTIIRDYQDDLPKTEMDYAKITQVIVNLLSNAIKFSPEESDIEISIHAEADDEQNTAFLRYIIKDHGTGIPESEVESIFDKFIQSSKTKTHAGGTGLGLSICKEIITLHNGTIWAENNPEGGSRFIFIIPINQPSRGDES